mmetsp:Transcript_35514/g.81320  ORF Transcript_35514/g.81320 Transcript_35514/m.81320 type:complete len:297 (+) Transcript_35514:89-979(+)
MKLRTIALFIALFQVTQCFAVEEEEEENELSYDTLPGINRYTRFDKTPQPEDTERIILAAGDVKCDVCVVILMDILQSLGKQLTRENIEEALEADDVDESAIDAAIPYKEQQVLRKKRGCNKLYKDNFFMRGFDVYGCYRVLEGVDIESVAPYEKAKWTCSNFTGTVPSRMEINTYTLAHEAVHHACEYTLGSHRDSIAKYVASELRKNPPSSGDELSIIRDLAVRACEKKAQCQKRKPSESVEARVNLAKAEFQGQGEAVLENYLKEEKDKKKATKKAPRRKKKKDGQPKPDVEL